MGSCRRGGIFPPDFIHALDPSQRHQQFVAADARRHPDGHRQHDPIRGALRELDALDVHPKRTQRRADFPQLARPVDHLQDEMALPGLRDADLEDLKEGEHRHHDHRGEDRADIVAYPGGHADRGHRPQSRGRGQSLDRDAGTPDGAGTQKADAHHHVAGHPRRIGTGAKKPHGGHESVQRRSHAHQNVRAKPGGLVRTFPLPPNHPAQHHGQHEAQDGFADLLERNHCGVSAFSRATSTTWSINASTSLSSGRLATILPPRNSKPIPRPQAIPKSAIRASPGPFTAHPMTATLTGASIRASLRSTSWAMLMISTSARPQDGQATSWTPRVRSPKLLRISNPALTSSTGSAASDTRIVSPIPRARIAPIPAADLIPPVHAVPASVIPTCRG